MRGLCILRLPDTTGKGGDRLPVVKRIITRTVFVLLFLFLVAAMILYDKGYYDFTFYDRNAKPAQTTSPPDIEEEEPFESEADESEAEKEESSEEKRRNDVYIR